MGFMQPRKNKSRYFFYRLIDLMIYIRRLFMKKSYRSLSKYMKKRRRYIIWVICFSYRKAWNHSYIFWAIFEKKNNKRTFVIFFGNCNWNCAWKCHRMWAFSERIKSKCFRYMPWLVLKMCAEISVNLASSCL